MPRTSSVLAIALVVLSASQARSWVGDDVPSQYVVSLGLTTAADVIASEEGEVVKRSAATGAVLWRAPGFDSGPNDKNIAVDAAGNAVVTGFVLNSPTSYYAFVVAKYDGTGAELWRTTVADDFSFVRLVIVDGNGDVFAAGTINYTGDVYDLIVLKLSGSDGSELWRLVFPNKTVGSHSTISSLAVDTAGDLVIATDTIIKVSGGSGSTLWDNASRGERLALTDDDDVVASVAAGPPEVVRLAGASGAELWRAQVAILINDLKVFAGGDSVAVAGMEIISEPYSVRFAVARLNGPTNTELWRTSLSGTQGTLPGDAPGASDVAWSLAVDSNADVVAAGSLHNTTTHGDFAVVKFDGLTGTERWRRLFNSSDSIQVSPDGDAASTVAVGPNDDIVAGGILERHSVVKLRSDGGDACGTADACGFCETCDSTGVCVAGLRSGCRVPVNVGKSKIKLKTTSGHVRDSLRWVWARASGTPTALGDFGDPRSTAPAYALCVLDDTSSSARVVAGSIAPAGGTCAGRPCWRLVSDTTLEYRDPDLTPDGLKAINEHAGHFAGMSVTGKGANLNLPGALGLTPPIVVQWQSETGQCWQVNYGASGIQQNTPTLFSASGTP